MRQYAKSKFVCGRCFGDDEGLIDFCTNYAQQARCDFCGSRGREPIAAPLNDVLDHVKSCITAVYDDPDNAGLGYDSEEGGYVGTTLYTDEVLDEFDLDFSRDKTGELRDIVIRSLGDHLWCEADPYGLTPRQQLQFSWDHFCEIIKHQRRYFFFQMEARDGRPDPNELYSPSQVLERIFSYAEQAGAFVDLPADTRLYRARWQARGQVHATAGELGPPPIALAVQTNRMSPPGIVMTYASEDRATALAETANEPGTYAVGEFVTGRDALILDLTRLPTPPSAFAEISDSYEYDPRPRLGFLRSISAEISRPIAHDHRLHIEYVPTQVVTEYVRTAIKIGGRNVEGIRYRSSRNPQQTAVVLFADRDNVVLEAAERGDWYSLSHDRWLRLDSVRVRRVTQATLRAWRRRADRSPRG